MKRKLAEAAAASKSSRSRKSKAKAAAAAQPAAASAAARSAAAAPQTGAAVGPPGYAPPAAAFPALGSAAAQPAKKDTDWEKVGLGCGASLNSKAGAWLRFMRAAACCCLVPCDIQTKTENTGALAAY